MLIKIECHCKAETVLVFSHGSMIDLYSDGSSSMSEEYFKDEHPCCTPSPPRGLVGTWLTGVLGGQRLGPHRWMQWWCGVDESELRAIKSFPHHQRQSMKDD